MTQPSRRRQRPRPADAAAVPPPKPLPALPFVIGLVLLVLFTFLPALSGSLLRWDDTALLAANPLLNPPTLKSLGTIWSEPVAGLYTPLSYTLWAAVAAVFRPGEHPAVFHAINLLLHAGAAAGAFMLLRVLVANPFAAFAGAAVFAVHPLQVEPVAWVAGMNNLLAGGLGIVSLWLYVVHARADDRPRRVTTYALASAALVGAMLAKPTAVVVPVLAVVLDLFVLRRGWRKALIATVPWLLAALGTALIARAVQPATTIDPPPLAFRPVVAMDALAFYAGKVAWPAGLCIDYGRTPQWLAGDPARFYTWVVPMVLVAAAAAVWRRWPWGSASLALFAAGLLPMLGLTPFDFQRYSTVADRYAYLPMLGVGLLVAAAARDRPRIFLPAAGLATLALAAASFLQSLHWEDDASVMTRALAANPTSLAANRTLAAMLVDAGRPGEALVFARRAVEHHPRSADAQANLAAAHIAKGDFAAAAGAYEAGLAITPDDVSLLNGLSAALAQSGQPAAALATARRAVELAPDFAAARLNLGTVLAQLGQTDEAIAELRAAEALQPGDPMTCTNLAALLLEQGKPAEAAALLERALRTNPGFSPARRLLAELESRRRP